jgi:hypothetical protein
MKKFIIAALAICSFISANAQETYFGSQKGGFALSFNANPLLNYAGNMFNGTQNNSLSDFEGIKNDLFGGITITGKYFVKDNLAIDLGFGFDNNYNKINKFENTNEDQQNMKTGFNKSSKADFMFKAGVEYLLRPGKRLQPIAGIDIVYVHGNQWASTETNGYDADNKLVSTSTATATNPVNKLGIIANVGVEYFVCKSISFGATLNFGFAKTWNRHTEKGEATVTTGGTTTTVTSPEIKRTTSTTTQLKTGNNWGGNINVNFYF